MADYARALNEPRFSDAVVITGDRVEFPNCHKVNLVFVNHSSSIDVVVPVGDSGRAERLLQGTVQRAMALGSWQPLP